jgi:hypothetical protein
LSYALRNSIVLVVLVLIVVIAGGYIWGVRQPAKIDELQVRIDQLDREIARIPGLIAEYNRLTEALEDQRHRWEGRSKDIPQVDITGQTYDFFNRSIDNSGGYVKLDMIYGGMQQQDRYGYNIYNLRGEAPFPVFYRFLWYLENSRRLYRLHQVNLRGVETRDTETEMPRLMVTFEMQLRGFFTDVAELHTSTASRPVRPNVLAFNPFQPLILSDIPPNIDNLIEAERSELRAVLPDKAILIDHTGEIRTIRVGDQVYLGYVTSLNPELSKVEFILNKGGIIERFNLYIPYNGQQVRTR